jgi:7-keto-8-aminopelargonate synthetase-like enzyme
MRLLYFAQLNCMSHQATQIDTLVNSVANGTNSSGGFFAGSWIIVDHQRINGTSFVVSATVPALLAVSASQGINTLWNTPSILSTLRGNVRAICSVLDCNPIACRLVDHPHLAAFCESASGSVRPPPLLILQHLSWILAITVV